MRSASDIQQKIGQLLWSIFRQDADKAVFLVQSFPNVWGGEISVRFYKDDEFIKYQAGETHPRDVWNQMRELSHELQRTPPFDRQPFTHMRLELNDAGQMKVDFAYIPEWDSWPGLFMKGVSELSEAEISPPYPLGIYGIDVEELNKRKARFAKEPYRK